MTLNRICVATAFLPVLAAADIRLESGGSWKASEAATTCTLEFYLRDHPHDVADHPANFMITLMNFAKTPRIDDLILDSGVANVLDDLLLIQAWPAVVSTPIDRLSLQAAGEFIQPVWEKRIPKSTRSFFAFSKEDTNSFTEAISQKKQVFVHWVHDDGHSDARLISVTGFAAKREWFECCKTRLEQ